MDWLDSTADASGNPLHPAAASAVHSSAMDALPTPLPRRKLPIGLQTLAKLRDQGCYYVDKTGMAIGLIESGSFFFLSRPRRCGKTQDPAREGE